MMPRGSLFGERGAACDAAVTLDTVAFAAFAAGVSFALSPVVGVGIRVCLGASLMRI